VGYGAYFAKNETVQWRLPLAISCVAPLGILIGIYWLPESPRFLSLVGRNEEALQVIKRIHHDPSDPHDSAAHAEYVQIVKQVDFERQQNSSYIQMFKKPSWRKRSLIALFLMFATQSTGCLGITTFQVIIYQSLGLDKSMPLLMYGVYVTVAAFFNYVGALMVDKIGRRRLFCKFCVSSGTLK
jgi:cyanate permease